jgi:hypothetical protein
MFRMFSKCSHGLDHLATGQRHTPSALGKRCALGGTRTPNLLIRSQMLCPLSYERRSEESLARVRYAGRIRWSTGRSHHWLGLRRRQRQNFRRDSGGSGI